MKKIEKSKKIEYQQIELRIISSMYCVLIETKTLIEYHSFYNIFINMKNEIISK